MSTLSITLKMSTQEAQAVEDALSYYELAHGFTNFDMGYGFEEGREERRAHKRASRVLKRLSKRLEADG